MGGNKFEITFWGVRGSCPVAGEETIKFGGNTPCIELEIGDQLLILDAGTGINKLGYDLEEKDELQGHIFISHVHWDHIQGFPFFNPAFNSKNSFIIYGRKEIKKILAKQMTPPYFPISLDEMQAKLKFEEVKNGEVISLNKDIKVKIFSHPHPNGAFSFRIEQDNKVCCYVTDIEANLNWNGIVDFVSEADVVIYDSHFTENEYLGEDGEEDKLGWGHSTWQEGSRLAKAAGVKQLILFHHAPWRSDKQLNKIENKIQQNHDNTVIAKEGMVVKL